MKRGPNVAGGEACSVTEGVVSRVEVGLMA